MKTITTILVAATAAFLSSCCSPCGGVGSNKVCCGKASASSTAKTAATCSSPMSPTCKGECSAGNCLCKPQACVCSKPKPKPVAVVTVSKPKPKPAPKPAPAKVETPPAVVVAPPAPPKAPEPTAKVREGIFYWEFADPANRVPLPAGANPAASGFIPDPKTKGWTRVREYEIPAGSVPPIPKK